MDLKSLANAISMKEEVLDAEHEQEGIILTNLGQAFYDSGNGDEAPPELFDAVKDSSGRLEELEASLRALLESDEKRRDRVEESKTLKVEERNLKNRQEIAFEDLGRAAWDLWQSGKQPDEAMGLALQELSRADAKVHDVEVAAFQNESDVKSKSIFSRGRALLLSNRKKTASASMDRLWSRAGRMVYESTDLKSVEDEPTASALGTLGTLDSRLSEIQDRQILISQELEGLERSMEEMPGKGNVRRRVSHIEKVIDEARIVLDNAFLNLGTGWVEKNGERKASGEMEHLRKDWLAMSAHLAKAESDLEAFKAHRRYQEAESEKQKKASIVHGIEQEIKERQVQLKAEKKELAVMDKNLNQLSENLPPLPGDDQS